MRIDGYIGETDNQRNIQIKTTDGQVDAQIIDRTQRQIGRIRQADQPTDRQRKGTDRQG